MASYRDCPYDSASCQDSWQEANHTGSLRRKPFFVVVSAGSKRSQTVSMEAKYDGQSLQEVKISVINQSQQEAESHGQSQQEAIFRGH